MPIINQIPNSTLSLQGNGFNPTTQQPDWGYSDFTNNINPAVSKLHNEYSINSKPSIRLKNYNRNGVTIVKGESNIDELDSRAPNLIPTGVVYQAYKSDNRGYKQLGPRDGRY